MKTALIILGLLVAVQCMPINDVERSNAEAENCKQITKRDEQTDDALKRAVEESTDAAKDGAKTSGAAKEEPKAAGTSDKKSKRESTVQDTKAETTDKNGVAVAQSTLTTVKDDNKDKAKTKRTTVQNTESKGATSIALGNIDATHKNKGEALIQTTKSTGQKIAIATSKITMGGSKHHTVVVTPAATEKPTTPAKPTEAPAKPTEAPAKPTEAPAKPAEVTTTPAATPEASSPAATEAPAAATEAPAAPAAAAETPAAEAPAEAPAAAPADPAAAPADPSAPVTSSADATSSVQINATPEHSSVTV